MEARRVPFDPEPDPVLVPADHGGFLHPAGLDDVPARGGLARRESSGTDDGAGEAEGGPAGTGGDAKDQQRRCAVIVDAIHRGDGGAGGGDAPRGAGERCLHGRRAPLRSLAGTGDRWPGIRRPRVVRPRRGPAPRSQEQRRVREQSPARAAPRHRGRDGVRPRDDAAADRAFGLRAVSGDCRAGGVRREPDHGGRARGWGGRAAAAERRTISRARRLLGSGRDGRDCRGEAGG